MSETLQIIGTESNECIIKPTNCKLEFKISKVQRKEVVVWIIIKLDQITY